MNMKIVGIFVWVSKKKLKKKIYIIDIESTGCILPQIYAFILATNVCLSQTCQVLLSKKGYKNKHGDIQINQWYRKNNECSPLWGFLLQEQQQKRKSEN